MLEIYVGMLIFCWIGYFLVEPWEVKNEKEKNERLISSEQNPTLYAFGSFIPIINIFCTVFYAYTLYEFAKNRIRKGK